jgi:hypothetical protein
MLAAMEAAVLAVLMVVQRELLI